MSLPESIQAALLTAAPAYQDIAPQGAVAPYIVWTEVISQVNNSLQGASNVQNAHVQVDVYGTDPATRRTVATAAAAAILGISPQAVQIASQSQYEPDTKLFRAVLEFSIWSV